MKFRSVFLLFNVVVGASFLFVFAMPFFALGSEYAGTFWLANWPLALALVVILCSIDVFFLFNWRLFTLLEREDWPALTHYLEERVVQRGHWSSRLVRLLANTYLVLSDAGAVSTLEAKVRSAKPALLDKNALIFGVARVLANDPEAASSFFAERRVAKKLEDREWVEWYYAFSRLLARDFSAAADVLVPLASSAKDAIVVALTASFLDDAVAKALPARASELRTAAESGRDRVLKRFPNRAAWDKEVEKSRVDIHVVVLSNSIDEAASRLYA